MIIKQFRIAITLLALAAMGSLPVPAGQVVKAQSPPDKKQPLPTQKNPPAPLNVPGPPPPTYLELRLTAKGGLHSSWAWYLEIKNNTSSTIPRGTTIYWSLNAALKGQITTQYVLPPGESTDAWKPPDGWNKAAEINWRAWYYKVRVQPPSPPADTSTSGQVSKPNVPAGGAQSGNPNLNPPARPNVAKIPAATYLKCTWLPESEYRHGKEHKRGRLVVTNTTDYTIPIGTTIYWFLTSHDTGSFKLDRDLPPRQDRSHYPVCCGTGSNPNAWKAWYLK